MSFLFDKLDNCIICVCIPFVWFGMRLIECRRIFDVYYMTNRIKPERGT